MKNFKQKTFVIFIFVCSLNNNIFCSQEVIKMRTSPVGLENFGCTCYLNSCFQCLYKCDDLTQRLLQPDSIKFYSNNPVSANYINLIKEYSQFIKQPEKEFVSPLTFAQLLVVVNKWTWGGQEDAQEALSKVIDLLIDSTDVNLNEFILACFNLKSVSITTCCKNHKSKSPTEPLLIISAETIGVSDNPNKKHSVQNVLDNYFSKEQIDYVCDRCNTEFDADILEKSKADASILSQFGNGPKVPADKQIFIENLPDYVVIQLKIFQDNGAGVRSKISFEPFLNSHDLNLAKYLIPDTNLTQVSDYELIGLSLHGGALGGGHYAAIVKYGQQWYSCNDTAVEKIGLIDFQYGSFRGLTPYLLFYKKQSKMHDKKTSPVAEQPDASLLQKTSPEQKIEANTRALVDRFNGWVSSNKEIFEEQLTKYGNLPDGSTLKISSLLGYFYSNPEASETIIPLLESYGSDKDLIKGILGNVIIDAVKAQFIIESEKSSDHSNIETLLKQINGYFTNYTVHLSGFAKKPDTNIIDSYFKSQDISILNNILDVLQESSPLDDKGDFKAIASILDNIYINALEYKKSFDLINLTVSLSVLSKK